MQLSSVVFLAMLAFFVSPVAAKGWDAGDTIALILGLIIGFVCVCAGLGWYSRRDGSSGYDST